VSDPGWICGPNATSAEVGDHICVLPGASFHLLFVTALSDRHVPDGGPVLYSWHDERRSVSNSPHWKESGVDAILICFQFTKRECYIC